MKLYRKKTICDYDNLYNINEYIDIKRFVDARHSRVKYFSQMSETPVYVYVFNLRTKHILTYINTFCVHNPELFAF